MAHETMLENLTFCAFVLATRHSSLKSKPISMIEIFLYEIAFNKNGEDYMLSGIISKEESKSFRAMFMGRSINDLLQR